MPLLIYKAVNHIAKRIYRVIDRTAVVAGVQVFIGTGNLNLQIGKTAHSAVDRWHLL